MESTKEFQEETRRYFDRLAKDYDDSCDGRFVRCMYREVIRRAVSLPGDRVLDLGCGNGNLIRMPVSYTHLDVYKRQVQQLPVSGHGCVRRAGKYGHHHQPD